MDPFQHPKLASFWHLLIKHNTFLRVVFPDADFLFVIEAAAAYVHTNRLDML